MEKFLLDWLKSATDNFDTQLENVISVLTGRYADAFHMIVGIADGVIRPVAILIAVVCLLISFAQVAAKVDLIKWEMGVKLGIKFVFTKLMIERGHLFLEACWNQAGLWIRALVNASGVGSLSSGGIGNMLFEETLKPIVEDAGTMEKFALLLPVLIFVLATWIIGMFLYVIAVGRLFEIYVLLLFAPIGFAFFPLDNGDGSGFSRITGRFVRTFAAACLHGVMIIGCLVVFNVFTSAMVNTAISNLDSGMFGAMFGVILIQVVLAMAVAKSRGWANAILDAA
jgi:hypothetical protein